MAGSVTPHMELDLKSNGSHTIRLGNSIQRSTSNHLAAVRYNHRPNIENPDDTTLSIIQNEHGSGIMLSLKDGDEEYEFQGQSHDDQHTFILLPAKDGDGFVLERLDLTHTLNLTSAPWETDRHKLEEQYKLLDTEDSEYERLDGGDDSFDDDAKPDDDNPFDFRHYIQSSLAALSPAVRPERVRGETPLQVSQTASRTSTPIARPARKPTSAFPASKPKPKAKITSQPKPASPRVDRPAHQDVPSVRLERKGTIQLPRKPVRRPSVEEIQLDNLDDGDDGLVLEGADTHANSQRSLGRALAGTLGDGPISLRSAASSPGSRVDSPAPVNPHRPSALGRNRYDEDDIVMGDDDDDDVSPRHNGERHEDDEVEEDDGDVEDLALPSPVQEHRPSLSGTAALADDEDDLEKQMLMAMEADDDEPAPAVEEEEESEEE